MRADSSQAYNPVAVVVVPALAISCDACQIPHCHANPITPSPSVHSSLSHCCQPATRQDLTAAMPRTSFPLAVAHISVQWPCGRHSPAPLNVTAPCLTPCLTPPVSSLFSSLPLPYAQHYPSPALVYLSTFTFLHPNSTRRLINTAPNPRLACQSPPGGFVGGCPRHIRISHMSKYEQLVLLDPPSHAYDCVQHP